MLQFVILPEQALNKTDHLDTSARSDFRERIFSDHKMRECPEWFYSSLNPYCTSTRCHESCYFSQITGVYHTVHFVQMFRLVRWRSSISLEETWKRNKMRDERTPRRIDRQSNQRWICSLFVQRKQRRRIERIEICLERYTCK